MSKILAAQINKLPDNKELSAVLEYLCSESNKLYFDAVLVTKAEENNNQLSQNNVL